MHHKITLKKYGVGTGLSRPCLRQRFWGVHEHGKPAPTPVCAASGQDDAQNAVGYTLYSILNRIACYEALWLEAEQAQQRGQAAFALL